MTDIFIKTYPGDFIWLEYCIKSIEKFVTGFRDIVIVTDSGTELKIDSSLPIKIFYEDLPNETHPCPVGIGYAWAQSVKLNWTKYTDADYILQIDSDTMFTNVPKLVTKSKSMHISNVFCSNYFTLILNSKGQVSLYGTLKGFAKFLFDSPSRDTGIGSANTSKASVEKSFSKFKLVLKDNESVTKLSIAEKAFAAYS